MNKKLKIRETKNDGITAVCRISGCRMPKKTMDKFTASKQKNGYYVDSNIVEELSVVNNASVINTLTELLAMFNSSIAIVKNNNIIFNRTNYNVLEKQQKSKTSKKAFVPFGTVKETQGVYSAVFAFELQNLKILLQLPRTNGCNSFSKLQKMINNNKTLYNNMLNYMLTIHLKNGKKESLTISKNNNISYHGQLLAIKHGFDPYHATPCSNKLSTI